MVNSRVVEGPFGLDHADVTRVARRDHRGDLVLNVNRAVSFFLKVGDSLAA